MSQLEPAQECYQRPVHPHFGAPKYIESDASGVNLSRDGVDAIEAEYSWCCVWFTPQPG